MLLNGKIPLSYIWRKIKKDIFILFVFNTAIVSVKNLFTYSFDLPIAVPAFLGTAISLVLSFKLSQSYDRWWEARKVWGAIVNDSRSLVVQLKNYLPHTQYEEYKPLINRIGLRQIAWCYSLSSSLRKQIPLPRIKRFLTESDYKFLEQKNHIPLALMDMNLVDFKTLKEKNIIDGFEHIQLDTTYVRLCDSMGKAERIKNTVFPKTYSMFLRFFIFVFLVCLAISLDNLHFLFESLLLLTIATPFLLLQKTAIHLQDPFENRPTDAAMDTISQTIEKNITELLGIDMPVTEVEHADYYIL